MTALAFLAGLLLGIVVPPMVLCVLIVRRLDDMGEDY